MQLSLANLPKQAMEHNSIDFLCSMQAHSIVRNASLCLHEGNKHVPCSSERRETAEALPSEVRFNVGMVCAQFVSRHVFGYILNTVCFIK